MEEGARPTWAEIDLDRLAFNLNSAREFIGEEVEFMAIVKADAYGHGAVQCAKRLELERVDWFGVALPEEGIELRQSGITKPILCLGGFWRSQAKLLLEHSLTPAIINFAQATFLNDAAAAKGVLVPYHLKLDTGMNRVGVRSDELAELIPRLQQLKHIQMDGLMTHFAVADDLDQVDFTGKQISSFESAVQILQEAGFNPRYLDMANSPASIAHPQSRGNLVRLGGVLYGLGEDILPREIDLPELSPVLTLNSRIVLVKNVPRGETIGYGRAFKLERDSVIATIPIGYRDGYTRRFSGKVSALVGGRRVPVVGRISMDWTMLDVTEIANEIELGQKVTLIGESGGERISAAELGEISETISYEITCALTERVRREYISSNTNQQICV